jgi:hypothetical protein
MNWRAFKVIGLEAIWGDDHRGNVVGTEFSAYLYYRVRYAVRAWKKRLRRDQNPHDFINAVQTYRTEHRG